MEELKEIVRRCVEETIAERGREKGLSWMWRRPLLAFADAEDERFRSLKLSVSPTHLMPRDLLASARTVVCFFVPFSEEVPRSNVQGREASALWAKAYLETNALIGAINERIKERLLELGFESATTPATHNFDERRLMSDWSHRHIAHIAGLGSFGLHNLLITEMGCCGRLGSLVTSAPIPPSRTPHKERCLFKARGTCKACARRCAFGALREDGYDRHRCYEICLENAALHSSMGFADVCGKCSCGVPCSTSSPL